jgi:ABC-type dipeptide/oligopeptide/nickel transport system permease component
VTVALYILRRLGGLLFSLALLSVIVFSLMHVAPGGPFSYEQNMPDYMMQNIAHKYGLDRPVYEQYFHWLAAMLQGDFGIPYQSPTETVVQVVLRAWPITLAIGAISIAFAFGIGMLLGTIAAFNQNSWIDNLVTFGATLGMAVPSYVIGFVLIYVLSINLGLLPTGGWGEPKHLIMPVIAFSLGPMAIVARMTRINLLETLSTEYVRLARARGIPTHLIWRRYVLKNASIPMITVLLPIIPDLLTGSIFIEAVFTIPGLGRFFTTSALNRDYPMIMAMAMMIAVMWGLMYLISDVLYAVIDPRVRLAGSEAS